MVWRLVWAVVWVLAHTFLLAAALIPFSLPLGMVMYSVMSVLFFPLAVCCAVVLPLLLASFSVCSVCIS